MFSVDRHGSGVVGKGGASPDSIFSHYGPVTGIACHPNPEFGSLVLTSSFDRWVVSPLRQQRASVVYEEVKITC